MQGEKVLLEAVAVEFVDGGNTIWVHGEGGTILRVQCSGKIIVNSCVSPCPHADVQVKGNITVCVPDAEEAEENSSVH